MHNPQLKKVMSSDSDSYTYRFLQPISIQMIEEALAAVGDYGEVRLIVEKGRLRFLVTQKSYDILRWRPGAIVKEIDPCTE